MSQAILYGNHETTIAAATGEGERLWVPLADLERSTGWKLQPQGLCQGETCVPIPAASKGEWLDEPKRRFDLAAFAAHLGQTVKRDDEHGAWSFGPPVGASSEAASAGPVMAPDFTLPDLDGKLHSLSAYRGRKVFLFCWASW
jgi:hypothetical protein